MKQKILPKLLVIAILLLLCSLYASAYDFEVDGIYYNVVSSSNLTCEVTYKSSSYDTYSGSVTIPETVKRSSNGYTYTVVGIGSSAFRNSLTSSASLTEVIIPTTVTYIDDYAFWYSAKLKSLTIPNSVTSIGDYAFRDCTGLIGELVIPNSVTSIGRDAFCNCRGLTSIEIPNSVTSIESYTFYGCAGLTSIEIPNSVTSIGEYAFHSCTGLIGELVIPNSVTSIESYTFYGCAGLTSIEIPNSVTSIGSSAFKDCTNLTGELVIQNSVTFIGSSAFQSCGITSIAYDAIACTSAESPFTDCSNLSTIKIGENVESMPANLFSGCASTIKATSLNITPPTIENTTLGEITKVEVPIDGLIKYSLADCWSELLTLYAISNGDIYYPVPIFSAGSSIVTASGGDENGVAIKEGGTAIITPINGSGQISGIVEHTAKYITDILNTNNQYSFTVSNLQKMNRIYSYSLDSNNNTFDITVSAAGQVLEQVTVANINSVYYLKVHGDINGTDILTIRRMPNIQILDLSEANIVSGGDYYYNDSYSTAENIVGQYFFMDMTSLKVVKLPNSATSIMSYSCGNCTGLNSMEIPANVNYIDTYAFSGCNNITCLTIEDSSNSLTIYTGKSNKSTPFADCPLEIVNMGRTLTYDYIGFYSLLYNKSSIISLTIGNEVKSIKNYEFYQCSGILSDIIIPNNVTSIGDYAFDGCKNIPSVIIDNAVTSIGRYAFRNCSSLATLSLGNVSTIGDYAFYNCSSLKELTIPESVTSISIYAFANTGISILTINNSSETLSLNPYSTLTSTQFSNCSIETLNLGRNIRYNDTYSPFRSMKTLTKLFISSNVTSIEDYEFYGCTGLTDVAVSNNVTQLGAYAFAECSNITSLLISNQLTSIGNNAFSNCSAVTNVKTPNSLQTIGDNAFSGCSSLTTFTLGSSCSSIGSSAFSGCSALAEFYSKNPATPSISSNTFASVDKQACILYVPTGSLNTYWLHTYWSEFFDIREMDFDPNDDTDGIGRVISTGNGSEIVGYYTLDGKAINAPQKGINIFRYSDGTTKKVVVK